MDIGITGWLRYIHLYAKLLNKMTFLPLTFIGIDVSSGRRPYTLAALDSNLHLVALSRGEDLEMVGYCAGQSTALVVISAPSCPNQGFMSRPEVRQRFNPPPAPNHWTNLRQAEYELYLQGIKIQRTPASNETIPGWMQRGFSLYQSLDSLDYQAFPKENAPRQLLESRAEAVFQTLIGVEPFEGGTLEGRLQRQLILHEQDMPVPDPMNFFEEVTRHRLLHSILPVEKLFSGPELNALAVAYVGWLAVSDPDKVIRLGDPGEGQITLAAATAPGNA
jgi:hypothetical protein